MTDRFLCPECDEWFSQDEIDDHRQECLSDTLNISHMNPKAFHDLADRLMAQGYETWGSFLLSVAKGIHAQAVPSLIGPDGMYHVQVPVLNESYNRLNADGYPVFRSINLKMSPHLSAELNQTMIVLQLLEEIEPCL